MRKRTIVLTLAAFAIITSGSRTQQPEPPVLAEAVAPFTDNQTVALVHVDLAAFDSAEAVNQLAEFMGLSAQARDRLHANLVPLNVVADSLAEGQRADLFIVTSVSDLSTLPLFFVVPMTTAAASPISLELRRAAAAQLRTELATEQIGEALVTAHPRVIARLKKAPPSPRPELAAAFAAVGDSPVKLLVVPSLDARRAIEFLLPELPPQLGGGPTRALTGKLAWLAVGVDLPPRATRFRATVQATSADAARDLARQLESMLAALAGLSTLPATASERAHLANVLGANAAGDRVHIELSSAQIDELRPVLLPILKSAESALGPRAAARRPAKK